MDKLRFSKESAKRIGWRAFKLGMQSLSHFDWHGTIYHMRQVKTCIRVYITGNLINKGKA